jgi:subtilisin family serine protease
MVTYTTPRSGERSDFSNFGDWVEAWADGSDVVGTYLAGPYRYCEPIADTACDAGNGLTLLPEQAPTAHLASTVVWSGTSFAAPQVAIWIAAGNPAP